MRRGAGVRRALAGLLALVGAVAVTFATGASATDAPETTNAGSPFAYRGVIEGFYGTPYTPAERVDLIRWEARHGLNTYIHAPKEDPYVRTHWREQYPPAQLRELLAEVRLARSLGVDWVPNVGPRLPLTPSPNVAVPDRDICFSCPADRAALVAKLRPFVAAGARTVMVSFDDDVKLSSHPEDLRAYGAGNAAYGAMTADLLNAVVRAFPGVTVLTVPADYSGTSSTAYLTAFARRLDPSVVVFWTGPAVVSRTISGAQARAFDAAVHRRVVLWDNYPANDYAGARVGLSTNVFLGPLTGRGADLVDAIDGLVANPMDAWEPSKVALATVADFLDHPATYSPERSWHRALTELGGPVAGPLTTFAENVRASPLGQPEAVVFAPLARAFLRAYDAGGGWPASARPLLGELAAERAAPGRLRASGFDPAFVRETGPWLDRLVVNAHAGAAAVAVLAAERPAITVSTAPGPDGTQVVSGVARPPSPAAATTALAALQTWDARMLADFHNVHGNRLLAGADGPPYALGANHMDAFIGHVQERSLRWLPTAVVAASGVWVRVDGRPVPASFRVIVPPGAVVTVTATDAAGGASTLVLRADGRAGARTPARG